jgi:hypothetical protein
VSRVMFALGVPVAMAADLVLFAMLRRARPRPFGISNPAVTPALLSSATGQSQTRNFTSVVLCYGRPLRIAGQLMEVETYFAESLAVDMGTTVKDLVRFAPGLEDTITRAELRDQAWAEHDWMDETSVFSPDSPVEVPADGFERAERIVVVAGQERRVPVLSHGNCEALRFVHDSMVITAVARLGFPESPRFDVVDDLEPYLAAHRRFILSWLRFWER